VLNILQLEKERVKGKQMGWEKPRLQHSLDWLLNWLLD
jgi:hypothetical protein